MLANSSPIEEHSREKSQLSPCPYQTWGTIYHLTLSRRYVGDNRPPFECFAWDDAQGQRRTTWVHQPVCGVPGALRRGMSVLQLHICMTMVPIVALATQTRLSQNGKLLCTADCNNNALRVDNGTCTVLCGPTKGLSRGPDGFLGITYSQPFCRLSQFWIFSLSHLIERSGRSWRSLQSRINTLLKHLYQELYDLCMVILIYQP